MFTDITSLTLGVAIEGLSARSRVLANNIANLETPGFRARSVAFEDNLADAVRARRPETSRIEVNHTRDTPGHNGNSVNLERQVVTASQTGLQQKLITGAITSRFGMISTVLKGGA